MKRRASKKPARTAEKSTSTSAPASPLPAVTVNPRGWPRYTPSEQKLILDFLGAYWAHAATARDGALEIYRLNADIPGAENSVRYWENAISCIRWLGRMVTRRQKHLAVAKAIAKAEAAK